MTKEEYEDVIANIQVKYNLTREGAEIAFVLLAIYSAKYLFEKVIPHWLEVAKQ